MTKGPANEQVHLFESLVFPLTDEIRQTLRGKLAATKIKGNLQGPGRDMTEEQTAILFFFLFFTPLGFFFVLDVFYRHPGVMLQASGKLGYPFAQVAVFGSSEQEKFKNQSYSLSGHDHNHGTSALNRSLRVDDRLENSAEFLIGDLLINSGT